MTREWRERWTAAQTRGRTIERQADALRRALLMLANGEESGAAELVSTLGALREQLMLAERLAAHWQSETAWPSPELHSPGSQPSSK